MPDFTSHFNNRNQIKIEKVEIPIDKNQSQLNYLEKEEE